MPLLTITKASCLAPRSLQSPSSPQLLPAPAWPPQIPKRQLNREAATWCLNPRSLMSCRRSAVSRQACRILGLLAAALGARFDMYALYFLPIIFKITVITVQVYAYTRCIIIPRSALLHLARCPCWDFILLSKVTVF